MQPSRAEYDFMEGYQTQVSEVESVALASAMVRRASTASHFEIVKLEISDPSRSVQN